MVTCLWFEIILPSAGWMLETNGRPRLSQSNAPTHWAGSVRDSYTTSCSWIAPSGLQENSPFPLWTRALGDPYSGRSIDVSLFRSWLSRSHCCLSHTCRDRLLGSKKPRKPVPSRTGFGYIFAKHFAMNMGIPYLFIAPSTSKMGTTLCEWHGNPERRRTEAA